MNSVHEMWVSVFTVPFLRCRLECITKSLIPPQNALPFQEKVATASELQLSPEVAARVLADWQSAKAVALGPDHKVPIPEQWISCG